MTDAPPSRYKVVERGRRLVVIDTRTGQPAVREPVVHRPAPGSAPAARPIEATAQSNVDDRSGNAVLVTSRLYDLKGPRRIVIGEAASSRMSRGIGGVAIGLVAFAILAVFFPLILFLPFVLAFQPKVRAGFRRWTTARLDEAERAAS
ncbi:hypothetical protein [Sphingomonas sp.]|uniref:hypothetical protein n=1 Tax=Sphingomonas sp. TaxID=28214 RepID=UPI0031DC515B